MATLGGPALPVIVQNGGEQQGGAAIPVTVVSDGRAVQGGPATPIYLATGGPQQGGPALPVVAAPYGQRVAGGDAVPAYIVGGGYLPSVYESKVIALGPIAYWPLDEASGATAFDRSGNGRNGTYSNVTLAAAGIGDGGTSASFNGSTSFCNVFSASLAAAFNALEGSILLWFKVSGAGVWSDATNRRLIRLGVDANNQAYINKSSSANTVDIIYQAGGTAKGVSTNLGGSLAYIPLGLTWSKSNDRVRCYASGAQVGATATGLGVWAGSLAATTTLIGAFVTTPSNVFSGSEAQVAVFDRELSPAEVASAAVLT